MNATIGFFKTGAPIMVQVQGPSAASCLRPLHLRSRNQSRWPGSVLCHRVANSKAVIHAWQSQARWAITVSITSQREIYTVAISAKRYTFSPQMVLVNDNVTNLNFVAEP